MNVPLRTLTVDCGPKRAFMPGDHSRETPEEERNVWIRDRRNNSDHLHYSVHCEENLTDGGHCELGNAILPPLPFSPRRARPVAILDKSAHTSGMTLRNAAVFAIVGMALWTTRLALDLINSFSGVAGGIVPANSLLKSLIDFLAALSLLVFFVVFHRKQS